MTDTAPGFLKRNKRTNTEGYLPEAPTLEQSLEREVETILTIESRKSGIGNSIDMGRVQELLSNAVTAAHDDTGKALDKVRREAHVLMQRIDEAVDKHKQLLQTEGQKIATMLESAVQELTRTVEWVEGQSPKLRNPQLEPKENLDKVRAESKLLLNPSIKKDDDATS